MWRGSQIFINALSLGASLHISCLILALALSDLIFLAILIVKKMKAFFFLIYLMLSLYAILK